MTCSLTHDIDISKIWLTGNIQVFKTLHTGDISPLPLPQASTSPSNVHIVFCTLWIPIMNVAQ